jgi:hypothetical protein
MGFARACLRFRRFEPSSAVALVGTVALLGLSFALAGCSPHIGAKCNTNTDCSLQGTLVCDTSQPDGYCTSFNCAPDTCQNEAACVLLDPAVPGCAYDDYNSPNRTARSICLQQCHKNSDCRQSEGYICADPRQPPWNALSVDDDQAQLVCIVAPNYPFSDASTDGPPLASFPDAAVCRPTGPVVPGIEASVNLEEAGSPTTGE